MSRIHVNQLYGTLSAILVSGATTWSGAEVATLPVVSGSDILAVTLAPLGLPSNPSTAPEIIHVTAHSSGATTATIARGQEGTSARDHAAGEPWIHGPMALDVAVDSTSSDITTSTPGDAAAAGTTTQLADAGHRHGREGWGASGDITASAPGDATAAGATGKTADAGHKHARESWGATADIAAVGAAAAVGSTGKEADAGHVHPGVHSITAGTSVTLTGTATDPVINAAAGVGNEASAVALVNATSPGDAGNRAVHFTGNALPSGWSLVYGTATVVVGNSTFGITAQSSESGIFGPYAPTGSFRVEARLAQGLLNGIGFVVRDSGTTDSSGNGMMLQWSGANVNLFSLDSGSYNSRANISDWPTLRGVWSYFRLDYNAGTTTWTGWVSMDRSTWIQVGTYSKSFTVAQAGFRTDALGCMVDFFDVVS